MLLEPGIEDREQDRSVDEERERRDGREPEPDPRQEREGIADLGDEERGEARGETLPARHHEEVPDQGRDKPGADGDPVSGESAPAGLDDEADDDDHGEGAEDEVEEPGALIVGPDGQHGEDERPEEKKPDDHSGPMVAHPAGRVLPVSIDSPIPPQKKGAEPYGPAPPAVERAPRAPTLDAFLR